MFSIAVLPQIRQMIASGRYRDAAETARRLSLTNPRDQQLFFLLGLAYFHMADWNKSIEAYSKAIQLGPKQPTLFLNRGIVYVSHKDFSNALEDFRTVLKADHRSAPANTYAGICLYELGRFEDALRYFDSAMALDPRSSETIYNKARALFQLKRTNEALVLFLKAADIDPNNAECHNDIGNCFRRLDQPGKALAAYDTALRLNASHVGAHHNRAMTLQKMERWQEARAAFDRTLELKPDYVEAHFSKGVFLRYTGNFEEALPSFDKALELKPAYAEALSARGITLIELGRGEEALADCDRALALEPENVTVHNSRSSVLTMMERLDDALVSTEKALALSPELPEVYFNRGATLSKLGRFDEASAYYDQALARKNDFAKVRINRSFQFLLQGDFERGLVEYESRWFPFGFLKDRFADKPIWFGGESLAGKTILIHYEQGLGDTIQFSRYVELVSKMAARVYFAPQFPLIKLFQGRFGCEVVDPEPEILPQFDTYAPLLSLPLAFNTHLSSIPNRVPYLFAEGSKIQKWKEKIGVDGFKIGICWQGNNNRGAGWGRSFPVSQFEPLARLPGVRLISLHKGEGEGQLNALPDGMKVETLGKEFDQGDQAFLDTAAVMTLCDLVISSDTSVAHLAGALGVPVWVALKQMPDWRWLLDRSESPWYPTMRLFRQKQRGDWQGVFAEIEAALREKFAI